MDPLELTPAQIAGNCADPAGEIGRAVGNYMSRANRLISMTAYGYLQVDYGSRILEIGPGNGALTGFLVTNDNAVTYKGIDRSMTMVEAARISNADMIARGRVEFLHASAESIPFTDGSFERVVAVNCIVFWELEQAFAEVFRVLAPGGRLVVTSNSPETAAGNPFARPENGFRNLDLSRQRLLELHVRSGFKVQAIEDFIEDARRLDGTSFVRRSYITISSK